MDSEMWCRGRMGHKEHCCIGPISFWWFLTPFYTTCLLKFSFFRNYLSWEIQNLYHWIQHTFNPTYAATQAISMHFSQSKSTKCEIFAWNFYFSGTAYHRDWKPVHHWIQHALNPKYAPLKPFQCCFSQSKINKMWNFCLKFWFFRNHFS